MTIEAAMKFRTTSRALIAAAFLAGAVPAAQAFTFQNSNGSSGGQGFMDLDKPAAPPDRRSTRRFRIVLASPTTARSTA